MYPGTKYGGENLLTIHEISGKSQRFFEDKVFWPEISALGIFLNVENERMYPPKYRA